MVKPHFPERYASAVEALQALDQLQSGYTPTVQVAAPSYQQTNVVTPQPTRPVHAPTVVSEPNQTGNRQETSQPQPDIKPTAKSNNLPIFITVLLSTFIAAGGLYIMATSRPPTNNPTSTNPSVTNTTSTNPSVTNTFGNAATGGDPGTKYVRNAVDGKKVIAEIGFGERVEISAVGFSRDNHPWYKIRTSRGVDGWMACQIIDCDRGVGYCQQPCPTR
jgi:hypothetical protein